MGWSGTWIGRGKRSVNRKEMVEKDLNTEDYDILKSRMVGSTYYAAMKRKDNEQVFAVVVLTSLKDGYFYTKIMDESVGPCYYDCPESIMKLLTETEYEYAKNWRQLVEEKRNKPDLNKLPIGTMIAWTTHDGKERKAYKHEAAYQFKRPFWMLVGERKYISKKYIPCNFTVCSVTEQ